MLFGKQTTRLPSVHRFAEPRPRSCALVSNAYLLLDYGESSTSPTIPRTARTLHTLNFSNPAEAYADVVATRLNGQDTTSSQHYSRGSGNTGFSRSTKSRSSRRPQYRAYWRSRALCGSWRDGVGPCTARCTTLPPWETCRWMQNVTGYGAPAPYPVDKPDIMLGLAFTHSLARIYWCMYHSVGNARGLARVGLLSIYCTVVVFFFFF